MQSRIGLFDSLQPVADDAPAIERLVAFLGRLVKTSRSISLAKRPTGNSATHR
jgi:hypothetical protein